MFTAKLPVQLSASLANQSIPAVEFEVVAIVPQFRVVIRVAQLDNHPQ